MPSGGFRLGAGRPRKNKAETEFEGKAKPPAVPRAKPEKVNSENVMADYFAMAMKECGDVVPTADALRAEVEAYIAANGCEGYVAPQTITDYVLNRQGFLACEAMNRKIGRIVNGGKQSPYFTMGQGYHNAARNDFNLILQIINKYGGKESDEKNGLIAFLANRGF